MNHNFCITGVSWRQRVEERSVVTYITPRRETMCYKKVCKSCTFYNRSTFFVVYFITGPDGATVETVYSVKSDDNSETSNGFLPAGYDKPVYVYENIPT